MDLAVLANDSRSNVVLVPGFITRVLYKFVLKSGDDALKRVSNNEKLEVSI